MSVLSDDTHTHAFPNMMSKACFMLIDSNNAHFVPTSLLQLFLVFCSFLPLSFLFFFFSYFRYVAQTYTNETHLFTDMATIYLSTGLQRNKEVFAEGNAKRTNLSASTQLEVTFGEVHTG